MYEIKIKSDNSITEGRISYWKMKMRKADVPTVDGEYIYKQKRPCWYFSKMDIEVNSPSRKDGIDLKKETQLRNLYCSFLQELGVKLGLPHLTIATAIMFCHRFYLHQSHLKNDSLTIAAICLFLASKSEDTPCSLNKIVVLSYELMYRKDPAYAHRIYQKEVFETQKSLILNGERLLLSAICFDVNVEHPYRPLIEACTKFGYNGNGVMKTALDFVNDGLRSTLCLQYKPHYIAAGSLSLAAKLLEVKLPSTNGHVWWHEFEVAPRQLAEVIREMNELLCYKRAVDSQKSQKPVQIWPADRNNDISSNRNADYSQKHQKLVQCSQVAVRNDDFSSPESCVLSRPGSSSNSLSHNILGVTCGAQQGVSTNQNSSCDKRPQDNKTSIDYHGNSEHCRTGDTERLRVVKDCQSCVSGNGNDSNNLRVPDQHTGSLSKSDRNGIIVALVKNLPIQNESTRRIDTREQKNAGTCTASALESVIDMGFVPDKKRRIGL